MNEDGEPDASGDLQYEEDKQPEAFAKGDEENHPNLEFGKAAEVEDEDDNIIPSASENELKIEDPYELGVTPEVDPKAIAQTELIKNSEPTTELEKALSETLQRKEAQLGRLHKEIAKYRKFIIKRKQTYKRKRKEEGAPTRALSAYNIFIRERFAQLAKENDEALKSDDVGAQMKRVPPAKLVEATGSVWKELPPEEKAVFEERARKDRKRYEEQMAQYQAPDKQINKKRNKTGYNMFFSAHVLRLKQTETGVPSERGSVARLVGNAWKTLSSDEKQFYEREADKHNGMHPVKVAEEEEEEEDKREPMEHYHMMPSHPEMQAYHPGMAPPMQQHDPRHQHHYYPPHMYGQPPYHYDYSQHHQRHHPQQQGGRGYSQGYSQQRHGGYDPQMPM